MGFFDIDSDEANAHKQYQGLDPAQEEHKAKLSHELISGAAAYEAAKAYEDHVAKNGKPVNHAQAKEVLAGFAGAFIDREFETKGLDFLDKEKAKDGAQDIFERRFLNHDH